MDWAIFRLTKPKIKAAILAVTFGILPLAIGLFLLIGWSLSLDISLISLNKYIAEDIKQKLINP